MHLKSYGLTFASHNFITSPSGVGKNDTGLYVGKSVCDKNQSFIGKTSDVAMAHCKNRGQWI